MDLFRSIKIMKIKCLGHLKTSILVKALKVNVCTVLTQTNMNHHQCPMIHKMVPNLSCTNFTNNFSQNKFMPVKTFHSKQNKGIYKWG